MAAKTKSVQLRDILYELSLAKPVPDSEVLDDFIRRYPEHAAALTDFAIELALDGLADTAERPISNEVTANKVSPAVSRAMSRFQNRLYEFQNAQSDDLRVTSENHAVTNPFAKLSRSDFRSLSNRLNVNPMFLLKLRDRIIVPTTMTDGFQQHVAEGLNVPIGVIKEHCNAQPQIQFDQRFKAEQKPEATARQTFKEAVQSSGLTPEQQQFLLSL